MARKSFIFFSSYLPVHISNGRNERKESSQRYHKVCLSHHTFRISNYSKIILKSVFSEKATKFEKIFILLLTRAWCSVPATAYLSKSQRRFFKTNVVKSYHTNFIIQMFCLSSNLKIFSRLYLLFCGSYLNKSGFTIKIWVIHNQKYFVQPSKLKQLDLKLIKIKI